MLPSKDTDGEAHESESPVDHSAGEVSREVSAFQTLRSFLAYHLSRER